MDSVACSYRVLIGLTLIVWMSGDINYANRLCTSVLKISEGRIVGLFYITEQVNRNIVGDGTSSPS